MGSLASPLAFPLGDDLHGLYVDQYARQLKDLLPPGRWKLELGSVISRFMLATAEELSRIHQRSDDLLREVDPRQTVELLEDFERVFGLTPGISDTEAQRQARITSSVVAYQRLRVADLQTTLAPVLGLQPAQVRIIEITRDDAIAMRDDREVFRFFVYRDPSLGGSWDVESAQELLDRITHAHTKGHVCESINFLCDDPYSLCDRDPIGPLEPFGWGAVLPTKPGRRRGRWALYFPDPMSPPRTS